MGTYSILCKDLAIPVEDQDEFEIEECYVGTYLDPVDPLQHPKECRHYKSSILLCSTSIELRSFGIVVYTEPHQRPRQRYHDS